MYDLNYLISLNTHVPDFALVISSYETSRTDFLNLFPQSTNDHTRTRGLTFGEKWGAISRIYTTGSYDAGEANSEYFILSLFYSIRKKIVVFHWLLYIYNSLVYQKSLSWVYVRYMFISWKLNSAEYNRGYSLGASHRVTPHTGSLIGCWDNSFNSLDDSKYLQAPRAAQTYSFPPKFFFLV